MWPEKGTDFVKVPGDEAAKHYGCYCDEKLVSVLSVFVDGQSVQFRKFATLEEYQRKGFGTALLEHVLDDLKHQNYKQVWCSARFEKAVFYQKFGLKIVGEPFEKNGKWYVKMLGKYGL